MTKSNYKPLQVLAKQFKACMSVETSLSPEERKNHEFQIMAMVDSTPILIVKGGANTVAYRIGRDGPLNYLHPVAMVDLLDEWQKNPYVKYILISDLKRKSALEVGELLKIKPQNAAKIVGVTITGAKKLLYTWKPGVFNGKWESKK